MGMIGGVAEVTPNHHSRVIEQRTSFFLDHIEGRKELVEMPDYVFLNPAELLDDVGPSPMMRKGMPSPRCSRDADGPVDPVE